MGQESSNTPGLGIKIIANAQCYSSSPEVEHLEPVQFVEDPGGELPHAVVLQTQLLEAGQ